MSSVRQSEIREHLCGVDRCQAINSFDLNQDVAIDDKIDSKCTIDLGVLVSNGQTYLSGHLEASFEQLVTEATLVSGFEESRSEFAVDLDGGADDLFDDGILNECRHAGDRCKRQAAKPIAGPRQAAVSPDRLRRMRTRRAVSQRFPASTPASR